MWVRGTKEFCFYPYDGLLNSDTEQESLRRDLVVKVFQRILLLKPECQPIVAAPANICIESFSPRNFCSFAGDINILARCCKICGFLFNIRCLTRSGRGLSATAHLKFEALLTILKSNSYYLNQVFTEKLHHDHLKITLL